MIVFKRDIQSPLLSFGRGNHPSRKKYLSKGNLVSNGLSKRGLNCLSALIFFDNFVSNYFALT